MWPDKNPNVYKSCPKMISLEKWYNLTPLQKLPKIVGDLGQLIVAIGFKNCPKSKKLPNLVTLVNVLFGSFGSCLLYVDHFKFFHKNLYANSHFFLNMGQYRPLFRLFLSFSHHKSITNWKSVDGVLGIRTRGRRMEGADKTTELRQPPKFLFKMCQEVSCTVILSLTM